MKLYAVRIFVKDFEQARDFYGKTLGLTENFIDDDHTWAEFDIGGPVFGLQKVANPTGDEAKFLGRFLGVSLEVDDIQKTYEELQAKGVAFVGEPEKQPWGGTLAFFQDPEGNEITLIGQ